MTTLLLDPPTVSNSTELSWVLRHACAADVPTSQMVGDSRQALALARRLEVSGRIASRLGREGCRRELGEEVGSELFEDFLTNVAVTSALEAAQQSVNEVAARHGVPLVWLKFAGLAQAGVVVRGSRVASDVDVLTTERHAEVLWKALTRDVEFRRFGARRYEHQLEPLATAAGAVVEVHTKLPGVRAAGAVTFAKLEDLERLGAVRGSAPSLPVLAAHALAHGLLQNAATPQSYSLLRMLCDLIDLRRRDPDAVLGAAGWLDAGIGESGARAAAELCRSLEGGEVALSSLLLRHCLAARLDEDYANRLRLRGWSHRLSDEGPWRTWAARIASVLLPREVELAALHGPATSRWHRASQRVARPFRLLHKAWRTRPRRR